MNVVLPAITSREAALDRGLGACVDRRGRVVEDQDPRVGEERAGDRDPLALAARERQAALADQRLVAVGEALDEAVRLRAARRGLDLLARRVGVRVGDVLGHRGGEQEAVVGDEGDLRAQRAHVHGRAGRRRRRAPTRGSGRTAARGGRPGSSSPTRMDRRAPPFGPRSTVSSDVLERGRAAVVGERDVAQLDRAGPLGKRRRIGRRTLFRACSSS